jgi:hypothetical protein
VQQFSLSNNPSELQQQINRGVKVQLQDFLKTLHNPIKSIWRVRRFSEMFGGISTFPGGAV